MPGYIRGFLEEGPVDGENSKDKESNWECLSRIDSVFVPSQSDFKYVTFGTKKMGRFFDEFPHSEGFPDDMAVGTKFLVTRPSLSFSQQEKTGSINIEEEFQKKKKNLSKERTIEPRHLKKIDWDKKIDQEIASEARKIEPHKTFEGGMRPTRLFKLVSEDGEEYLSKQGHHFSPNLWDSELENEQVREVMEEGYLEQRGNKYHLERVSRRDILPPFWFNLLERLETKVRKYRMIFYWHH